jgi:transposase
MDEPRFTTALDTDIGAPLKPVRRIEVLGRMAGRRRVWTLEQKLALVSEMERCDNIAAFAREREISTALLYTWRRELRYAMEAAKLPPRNEPMFVPVVGATSQPSSDDGIEVEVGGAVVRIGQAARTDLVVAIIQALQATAA